LPAAQAILRRLSGCNRYVISGIAGRMLWTKPVHFQSIVGCLFSDTMVNSIAYSVYLIIVIIIIIIIIFFFFFFMG